MSKKQMLYKTMKHEKDGEYEHMISRKIAWTYKVTA